MTRPDIAQHAAAFEDTRQILTSGRPLSRLEFSGLVLDFLSLDYPG